MQLYIVTGASRGLGLSMARQLAAEPDTRLVTISRAGLPADVQSWHDLRTDLADNGGQIEAANAISRALSGQSWSRAVLINNAGIAEPMGIGGAVDAALVQRSIAVNLAAAMVLMNAFLVASAAVPARTVVNISSGLGRRPMAGSGAYCATKAGLDMASRVAALETQSGGHPVTICSLAPGIIDTDMQAAMRGTAVESLPDVAVFRAFKSDGMLKSGDEVAARILALERAGKLPAGIADLRELG